MNSEGEIRSQKPRNVFSYTLAVVAGQVGCLTSMIVLAALFGGLWLDNRFGTSPMITVGLIIASIPVTLVVMVLIVRSSTNKMKAEMTKNENQSQEDFSGE